MRYTHVSESGMKVLAREHRHLGTIAERLLPSVLDEGLGSRAREARAGSRGGAKEAENDGDSGSENAGTPRSEDYERTLREVSKVEDAGVLPALGGGGGGGGGGSADAAEDLPEDKCREVTRISYCVIESQRLPGRAPSRERIVACVGWDRRIYLWRDDASDDGAIGYNVIIPEGPGAAHAGDIMCLAFCPPHFIATGAVDGFARLWGLTSRSMSAEFNTGAPVQCMLYIAKLRLLVLSGGSNTVYFINVRSGVAHDEVGTSHVGGITAIACDKRAESVVTGDARGYLKVWDVGNPFEVTATPLLAQTAAWRACTDTITGVDIVDSMQLLDTFLVVACVTGDVTLWTLSGGQVGMFGQRVPWALDVFSTYKSLTPPPETPRPPPPAAAAARGANTRVRRRSAGGFLPPDMSLRSLIQGDYHAKMAQKRQSAASLLVQELQAEQVRASPGA